MKIRIRRMLSLLLMLGLFAAFLCGGAFAVDAVHPNEIDEDVLIDIAALAESRSHHPVAESIVNAHGKHIDASRLDCKDFSSRANGLGSIKRPKN